MSEIFIHRPNGAIVGVQETDYLRILLYAQDAIRKSGEDKELLDTIMLMAELPRKQI